MFVVVFLLVTSCEAGTFKIPDQALIKKTTEPPTPFLIPRLALTHRKVNEIQLQAVPERQSLEITPHALANQAATQLNATQQTESPVLAYRTPFLIPLKALVNRTANQTHLAIPAQQPLEITSHAQANQTATQPAAPANASDSNNKLTTTNYVLSIFFITVSSSFFCVVIIIFCHVFFSC
jgi:hypothetical protein